MSLKTYKPYTKSTRGTILVERKNIWKGPPVKSLTRGKISSGGRNNLGRITSRSKGSGHKKRYRLVDFYRNKINVIALGGITEKNLSKLKMLNIKGFAGIGLFKKKPAYKRPVFLKNNFFIN